MNRLGHLCSLGPAKDKITEADEDHFAEDFIGHLKRGAGENEPGC